MQIVSVLPSETLSTKYENSSKSFGGNSNPLLPKSGKSAYPESLCLDKWKLWDSEENFGRCVKTLWALRWEYFYTISRLHGRQELWIADWLCSCLLILSTHYSCWFYLHTIQLCWHFSGFCCFFHFYGFKSFPSSQCFGVWFRFWKFKVFCRCRTSCCWSYAL